MARETHVRFNINLQLASRVGRPEATMAQAIEKKSFEAVNYVVSEIAFRAARSQQQNIRNQISSKVAGIAMTELTAMGRKIAASAIGLGPGARWPSGREAHLDLTEPANRVLRGIDPSRVRPMSIFAVTGTWRARTEEYLRRKSKRYGHRKWWLNTGELRDALRNPSMYTAAYGPIRVAWIPESFSSGRIHHSLTRVSTLARGAGRTQTITTGRVELRILGRITNQMLNKPGERSYDSRFNGLFESLPENVEKKLVGRGDPFRSIIEPFLTFYINRQIPNRIFNALTTTIKNTS
jgi:hypothetical protein